MSTDDESPDNLRKLPLPVAQLRPKESALYSVTVQRDVEFCDHARATVDDVARTVRCAACKALLDPMDRLIRMAKDYDRRRRDYDNLVTEIKAQRERIAMLERMETNARARLRRLGVPRLEDWQLDQLIKREADGK